MKKKVKLVILAGCLLILVSTGASGISIAGNSIHEEEELEGYYTPGYLYYHADAGGPYSGDVGQSIMFDGSDSYVFTIINAIYEWDFADENDETPGYGKYATHTYTEPGVYYVTLTVINGLGQVYKDIAPVYINRAADHLIPDGGCSYRADVNEVITFDASNSYSNGAQIVEYFWDFGDGETAYGGQVTHSYDEERVYIITLDIKDSNGQTRHDVLHADIGRSYSDNNDLFHNIGSAIQDIIDFLLNNEGFTTGIFCNLLDAKIYTNYNGNEKLTELSGFSPLPKEIDVNDDGDKDIKVNDLKFFKSVWSTSLFDEYSRVWLQFETTLSEVIKISSDIQAGDDFTVCLQFDFDVISYYLDLDDTITRIGYHSPVGEEMPTSISITHILRPYILFRLFGFTNIPVQGVATSVVHIVSTVQPLGVPLGEPIDGNLEKTGESGKGSSNTGSSPEIGELEGEAQYLLPSQPAQPAQPAGSGEYWPEYGLRIQGSGGGSFSLISQFLNSAGSSKTTVGITYGSSASTLMYKLSTEGGIFNHATVFEIPGNSAEFFAIREKNSAVTEISTDFSFSTELVRGIGWSDQGVYLEVLGKFDAGLYNIYFDNPSCTLNIGELSFSTDGSFNLNFLNGAKLYLDGSAGFTLEDLSFNQKGGDFTAEIIGTLNLDIGNTVSVALAHGELEVGFNGKLTLSSDCEFVVNEESVTVGGEFSLDSTGTIKFTWGSNRFTIDLDAGLSLEISNLNFEVGNLIANAALIEIETNGRFDIEWNSANSLVTIYGGPGVSLGITDLNIIYGSSLDVSVFGSLEIQAGGWVTFGPNTFEAGFEGTLDLGTGGSYVEFEINGENIKVGGQFTLTGGSGEISFTWDNDEFNLDVSGGPELTVSDLYFEIGELLVEGEEISIGVSGEFNVAWDTINNEVTISAGSGVSLGVSNLDITYGTLLEIRIFGSLEIQAGGSVTFGPNTFEASFSGSLNLGTGGAFVEFEINGDNIKVGGLFTFTSGGGGIALTWDDDEFSLEVSYGPELSVEDLYFEVGDLKVTADEIIIGANGDFCVDWNIATSEVNISSDSGISFGVEDLNIEYGTTLDVSIVGSLEIQADGYITFAPGILKAGFTGSLNMGTGGSYCQFIINGDSIKTGGLFTLSGGFGEISFSWVNKEFGLAVSGGPSLTVEDLYFEAVIQGETFCITAGEIGIDANGDFSLDWDTVNKEIQLSSEAGVLFYISEVEFSYGTGFEIGIIGTLEVEANGLISISPGIFEASVSGSLLLSPGFGFEINTEIILLSGSFQLQDASGTISITWSKDLFSAEVIGAGILTINNLYFEIEPLKIDTDFVSVGFNGLLKIILDKANKKFEIGNTIGFGFDNLLVYTKENNQWYQVCSVDNFDITGGGYVFLERGTNAQIEIDFNGQMNLANLIITPPSSWNVDLSIGSATLWGDASINLEKDVQSGKFALAAVSGVISGQITSFDAYVLLGTKALEVSFSNFQIIGGFSIILDDVYDEVQIGSEGLIILTNFIAEYGNMDILATIDLDGNGNILATLSENNINIDADVNYIWDISLDSLAIGDWDAYGELVGDVVVDAQWGSGTGTVDIVINDPGAFHSFGISYNDLSLTLANITLNPGTISFEWVRDDNLQTGYFLIDSDFTQNIYTVNLAEITWGTKSISIGWPEIGTGDFKFAWDIPGKELTINNGIGNLGPTITYEDTSQSLEIFASALSVQDNYTKTLTMKWYESSGQITGVYLDTSNTYLAQYFEIGYIKGTSGKKIALYGLKCDAFYINRIGTDEFEWGGHIYIANQLTFSKLVSGDWKDFDVQWNFQGQEKWIKFDRDPAFDFTLYMGPAYILGFKFTAEFDLVNTEYFEFKWKIGISGKISIDTNWDYFSTIDLLIEYSSGKIDITAYGLRAENWWVSWTAWPPSQWNIQTGGSIQWSGIVIDVYYNGEWRHVWPWPWP